MAYRVLSQVEKKMKYCEYDPRAGNLINFLKLSYSHSEGRVSYIQKANLKCLHHFCDNAHLTKNHRKNFISSFVKTRGLYYETFYSRNLRIFVISSPA